MADLEPFYGEFHFGGLGGHMMPDLDKHVLIQA